jgi:hypothetical protein
VFLCLGVGSVSAPRQKLICLCWSTLYEEGETIAKGGDLGISNFTLLGENPNRKNNVRSGLGDVPHLRDIIVDDSGDERWDAGDGRYSGIKWSHGTRDNSDLPFCKHGNVQAVHVCCYGIGTNEVWGKPRYCQLRCADCGANSLPGTQRHTV